MKLYGHDTKNSTQAAIIGKVVNTSRGNLCEQKSFGAKFIAHLACNKPVPVEIEKVELEMPVVAHRYFVMACVFWIDVLQKIKHFALQFAVYHLELLLVWRVAEFVRAFPITQAGVFPQWRII